MNWNVFVKIIGNRISFLPCTLLIAVMSYNQFPDIVTHCNLHCVTYYYYCYKKVTLDTGNVHAVAWINLKHYTVTGRIVLTGQHNCWLFTTDRTMNLKPWFLNYKSIIFEQFMLDFKVSLYTYFGHFCGSFTSKWWQILVTVVIKYLINP